MNCAKDFKGTAHTATVSFVHILLMGGFYTISNLISNNLPKCNLHFNIPWPEDLSIFYTIRAVGIKYLIVPKTMEISSGGFDE